MKSCQALLLGAVQCPKKCLHTYPFCAEHMNSTYDVIVVKDNKILERRKKQSLVNVNFAKNISIYRNRKQNLCLKIKDDSIKCFDCLHRQKLCLKHNTQYLEKQYIYYDIKAVASLLPDGFPVGLIKTTLEQNSGDLVETVMQLQDRKNVPLCNIVICSKAELNDVLANEKFDNIISINVRQNLLPISPDWKNWLDSLAKNVLCLYFDDTQLNGPKPEDIKRVIPFAGGISATSKTLIHCHTGMLRSPAVAMILMMEGGMTLGQAGNLVKLIRPNAKPSLEILKMYREIKTPPSTDNRMTRSGKVY